MSCIIKPYKELVIGDFEGMTERQIEKALESYPHSFSYADVFRKAYEIAETNERIHRGSRPE